MTLSSSESRALYDNADRLARLGLQDEAWESLHEAARLSGVPVWKLYEEIRKDMSPELDALFQEHKVMEGRSQ